VFILHAKVLAKKARLWCVFIDYQRAFDTVKREALWTKLLVWYPAYSAHNYNVMARAGKPG